MNDQIILMITMPRKEYLRRVQYLVDTEAKVKAQVERVKLEKKGMSEVAAKTMFYVKEQS